MSFVSGRYSLLRRSRDDRLDKPQTMSYEELVTMAQGSYDVQEV